VILGHQELANVIQPVPDDENLWVLAAGPLPPNPAELLNGLKVREVFASLRGSFDLVLVDSPPVLPVTDAVVLSKNADGTLIIVAAGRTKRGDLRRTVENLAQGNAPIIGMILNGVARHGGYGRGHGYSYGPYVSDNTLKPTQARRSSKVAPRHVNGQIIIPTPTPGEVDAYQLKSRNP
jgi:capsular exopolysaccharide synthesis family protein